MLHLELVLAHLCSGDKEDRAERCLNATPVELDFLDGEAREFGMDFARPFDDLLSGLTINCVSLKIKYIPLSVGGGSLMVGRPEIKPQWLPGGVATASAQPVDAVPGPLHLDGVAAHALDPHGEVDLPPVGQDPCLIQGTPSPVLDLRRASDRRFHRVFGNPGPPLPLKSFWKGLYAHSGGR